MSTVRPRAACADSFCRASLPATAARTSAYLGRMEGGVMDEPATAQALAGAVLRGIDCGAVRPEAAELTGVDRARLEGLARRVGV